MDSNNQTIWIIYKTQNERFPFRLRIIRGKEILLDLYTQDRWPGTKGNIFCLRGNNQENVEVGEEELERSIVLTYNSFGARLNIVLDRTRQKRCSFLFLVKGYKNKVGEYEQIFWQTQQGLTGRKSKYKLSYYGKDELIVFVDTGERYAWNFPGAKIIKESLPVGDYAIKDKNGFLAIVERKTFDNMMKELGNMKKFHQQMDELQLCPNRALVIEATYDDFLNKKKIYPYNQSFTVKALAEIQAVHPKLSIIFASSRHSALVWTYGFFKTVQNKNKEYNPEIIRETTAKFKNRKMFFEDEVRRVVLSDMPNKFTTSQLKEKFKQHSLPQVRRILDNLKKEGVLTSIKKGRNIMWEIVNK